MKERNIFLGALLATTAWACSQPPAWHEAPATPAAETYAECWADRSNLPCVAGSVLFEKDGTAHPVVVLWTEPNGRVRVVRE